MSSWARLSGRWTCLPERLPNTMPKYSKEEFIEYLLSDGGVGIAPEDIDDAKLSELWAECLAAELDFYEAYDRLEEYLGVGSRLHETGDAHVNAQPDSSRLGL